MNTQLLGELKELANKERSLRGQILRGLQEVNARSLYLEKYSSLYEYLTKELRYAEYEAYTLIQAMRLINTIPEVREKIISGALQLSTLAQVQKATKSLPTATKKEVLQKLEGKSSVEVRKALAEDFPSSIYLDKLQPQGKEQWEIRMSIDNELKIKLERVQALVSNKYPDISYKDLLHLITDLALNKLDPAKKTQSDYTTSSSSRYIPTTLKAVLWKRDQGSCSYVNPTTKERCNSTHFLHVDHIHPLALGGRTELENLRLLCSRHNLDRAEKTFGSPPSSV